MTPAQHEELLSMLNDIKFRLDRLNARMTGTPVETPAPKPAASQQAQSAYEVADAAELDGQYGDPEVRKDPPRWKGESFAGCRYSQTSPEFLDCLAGFLTWAAEQAEAKNEQTSGGKPRAPYLRRDAARARGWAARIRGGSGAYRNTAHTSSKEAREERQQNGYQPPAQPEPPEDFVGDQDVPF